MQVQDKTILVVEDEQDIRDLIHFHLNKEQYLVLLAKDGEEALSIIKEKYIDLIILDLMLPKLSGIELCKIIKNSEKFKDTLILMATAKGEDGDIIKGLECGADDYITKPFSPSVLMARVKALLRRKIFFKKENEKELLTYLDIQLYVDKRKLYLENEDIELTYSEFEILSLLIKSPGQVFSRAKIVNCIRGEGYAISDRAIDVQIVSIRKKLKNMGQYIETVRGVGYRLREI
ncbi:MAG: response regulator transcription factor [Bdellovibrionales bacterium]|nr:response regulator transcription factor [Bdellovibrionales bacterium]